MTPQPWARTPAAENNRAMPMSHSMPHPAIPLTAVSIDRIAAFVVPSAGFVVAQSPVPGGLPGWLNGSIAGVFIIALLYAVKALWSALQGKESAMLKIKDEMIAALERERDTMKAESEKNRVESEKLRDQLQKLRMEMGGQG